MEKAALPGETLLAVDLGLKTGLALYGSNGRLRWYRSQNFGARARLKRGLAGVLTALQHDEASLRAVVLEGGGDLAQLWAREAEARGLRVIIVQAGAWRSRLLWPREQRTGTQAKATADVLARRVITWSGAQKPTSLRHDAAEAILIGLWGVLEIGWLDRPDEALQR